MKVRFADVCDRCGKRGPEYGSFLTCKECGKTVCPACAVTSTIDDETGRCQCTECRDKEINDEHGWPQPETHYVAGLLFDDRGYNVALIHKTHGPSCLVGKWNAIGGKIQPGEAAQHAMQREFSEEAGVDLLAWELFLILKGNGWVVHFYHLFSTEALAQVRTNESEEVKVFPVWPTSLPVTVPNLKWIIPMAIGHMNDHVKVYEVLEKETT